ncbi:hypothetical protein [Gimesia algae]|uniref:DUF4384 domain-containing protein n=1 Tax=Gimesia algae TaxID=2527971 RepID=A0A517VFQ3_9PLAN|nr:hypothetical protein [Gimesia algae]QDT91777.1 hypothetical protein Pan161_34400 [Gimesia algae]
MREMITTISSLIIIACCFCSFLASEEPDAGQNISGQISDLKVNSPQNEKPFSSSKLFKKVQAVELKDGVLVFVTIQEEGGLREHYFQVRNKNVILCNRGDVNMPLNSIKFEDDGSNTIIITIPPRYEVDLMEAMTSM